MNQMKIEIVDDLTEDTQNHSEISIQNLVLNLVRTCHVNEDSKSEEENGAERIRVKRCLRMHQIQQYIQMSLMLFIILISLKHLDGGVGGQTIVFGTIHRVNLTSLCISRGNAFMSAYLSVSDCVVKFVSILHT